MPSLLYAATALTPTLYRAAGEGVRCRIAHVLLSKLLSAF
jgi:hypothetical protein